MYHRDYGGDHYWSEKEADFRRTAEEVYAERKSSGAAVKYIADYLYHGLHHFDRAIEILFVANGEDRLDEDGQFTLVRYLHEQKRFGESIAILEPLVKLRPDNIEYRTRLMHAYFRTQRQAELLALLAEDRQVLPRAEPLGRRPARRARLQLPGKRAVRAIGRLLRGADSAAPAHATESRHRQRHAVELLRPHGPRVRRPQEHRQGRGCRLRRDRQLGTDAPEPPRRDPGAATRSCANAPDLDGFVVELNRQVEESGLENPDRPQGARRRVCLESKQYAKAITQLELARDAQPNDVETHKLLVECYDKQNDRAGAVRQLLASVELSRRDIELYKDLGRRYRELEQPDRGRAGRHVDRRNAAHRIGKPRHAGRNPPGTRPLGRRDRRVAASQRNPQAGTDRPARSSRPPKSTSSNGTPPAKRSANSARANGPRDSPTSKTKSANWSGKSNRHSVSAKIPTPKGFNSKARGRSPRRPHPG